jgi:ppGpp synthetase/RelA/SpoT-type nucleotidyltranferase
MSENVHPNTLDDRRWNRHLKTIQIFHSNQPNYEALCQEVSFVLKKRLAEASVEVSAITWRVKGLTSFLGKIDRKQAVRPFEEIRDIAGVRIVYLHKIDLRKIKILVRQNFEVLEEINKSISEVDRFGYTALHYLVQIKQETSGARYEDLKNSVCELQVRTVLQDAWAILDHHFRYKQESEIPLPLRREIHSLAGALETADNHFNEIAKKRARYINNLKARNSLSKVLLSEPINRDSLLVFLQRKFPDFEIGGAENHIDLVMRSIDTQRFRRIKDLNKALIETQLFRSEYSEPDLQRVALSHVALAMACKDENYRSKTILGDKAREVVKKYCTQIHGPGYSPKFAVNRGDRERLKAQILEET